MNQSGWRALVVMIAVIATGAVGWFVLHMPLPTKQNAPGMLPTAAIGHKAQVGVTPIAVRLPSPLLQPTRMPAAPIETVVAGKIAVVELSSSGQIIDIDAAEHALAAAMNDVRAQNGLAPYVFSDELRTVARAHSCDLATHATISHMSSDGRGLADRLAGAQPPWQWPSESIAVGTGDVGAVVAMWMDEPPEGWHRRNILDTEQREVGVGYCFAADDPSGNQHYWTADFSRR